VIGQAKGILMERHRLTAEQAFAVLSRASQEANRKLVDIAEALTATGALPDRP
jgi:AmiR/NasT family two-component response regulator